MLRQPPLRQFVQVGRREPIKPASGRLRLRPIGHAFGPPVPRVREPIADARPPIERHDHRRMSARALLALGARAFDLPLQQVADVRRDLRRHPLHADQSSGPAAERVARIAFGEVDPIGVAFRQPRRRGAPIVFQRLDDAFSGEILAEGLVRELRRRAACVRL